MPKGGPMIGRHAYQGPGSDSFADITEAPGNITLGSLDTDKLQRPSFEEDGAPPWETDPKWLSDNTNARKFVEVPATWELRWLSPQLIDRAGMRDWRAVSAADERVTVKNRSMIAPDYTIRRGGHNGMLLAYMPRHWVESRTRLKNQANQAKTQSAIDTQQQTAADINQGRFGPHVHVDSATHPTHTMGDGRTMTDN